VPRGPGFLSVETGHGHTGGKNAVPADGSDSAEVGFSGSRNKMAGSKKTAD